MGVWLSILAGLAAAVRWLASYFSAEARLKRKELAEERRKGKEAVEAERLDATYQRIEGEPPRSAEETVEELNRRFGGQA